MSQVTELRLSCYLVLIAKPGNKIAAILWPDPYTVITMSPNLVNMRPRQHGCHFADDISKSIFMIENVWILIKISLKFVPKGPVNNIPALVQIMFWRGPRDKPISEPMMFSLPMHIVFRLSISSCPFQYTHAVCQNSIYDDHMPTVLHCFAFFVFYSYQQDLINFCLIFINIFHGHIRFA